MDVTVRTITLGIADAHPLSPRVIARAADFLGHASSALEAQGYVVQTTRIATRPLFVDMSGMDDTALQTYVQDLQDQCTLNGVSACSLGPLPADRPDIPVDQIARVPQLLGSRPALHASVQLASVAHGVRVEAALPIAYAMRELANFELGEANFRFAALALCEPGGSFFPQAYHRGPQWRVVLGLQSAGLVERTIQSNVEQPNHPLDSLGGLSSAVSTALSAGAGPVVRIVGDLAAEEGVGLSGVDLSPAPFGDESIVAAIEAAGYGPFGAPGTLAVAAALTRGIQGTSLPTCGYCGLMLPVLEDRLLGQRCTEGNLSAMDLLVYSAVCGTGLDTVPIPGDTPPQRVAALLLDVATLAWRLHKPLSSRLFLVPGGHAGELTAFTSQYLTNTRILAI